jgi:amidase
MLPCADGSDMMGSLRTPAAFNNVFGFRTTPGCVPYAPSDDVFFQQFSVAGPIARNIPDLGLLLSVQAGFDARAPLSRRSDKPADFANALDRDMRGTRIGWLGNLNGHLPMEAGLMDTYASALHHFETVGCTIETARIDFDLDRLWNAWLDLRSLTFSGTNAPLYRDAAKRKLLKPEAVWEIERGLKLSGEDVSRAIRERAAWYQAMNALFDNFDYLLMPSAQVFPFDAELDWPHAIAGREMDSYHRWMEAVVPATMASLPALSAPAGFGPGGLPAGLQIIGPTQGDLGVLRARLRSRKRILQRAQSLAWLKHVTLRPQRSARSCAKFSSRPVGPVASASKCAMSMPHAPAAPLSSQCRSCPMQHRSDRRCVRARP